MSKVDGAEHALKMEGIGMCFGEVWVLREVSLAVRCGSIHAIVGHNGAGKSTLMKIALGAQAPTEGEVRVAGNRLTFSRPAEARGLGLGMVMQEPSLISTLSGVDNLFLNSERLNRARFVSVRRERAEVRGLFAQLGIARSLLSSQVSEMSAIDQKLIEIARALRLGSHVLILDEPTAPLGRSEIDRLFGVLRGIAARGTGIVLITHHLPEVFAVCDEVTCLREGSVVLTCATSRTNMRGLVGALLGHSSGETYQGRVGKHGSGSDEPPSLEVRHVRVADKLIDVSFDAFPGEILGIAGLAGSGRTTLLRALFGDLQPKRGDIVFRGERLRPRSPRDAIASGVYLIPEGRGVYGLVLTKSIVENVVLVVLRRLLNKVRLLRISEGRAETRRMMTLLNIRASGVDQLVSELSGGNQQKVVLSKALTLGADLLLLDEPTFGVDLATTRHIIDHVRAMAEQGSTVLWVSSDLLELTQVADRLIVLRDGVIGATIERGDSEFDEEKIVVLMQRDQFHHVIYRKEPDGAAS
jgi:ABC-type sugar transport system ATPase subunit